MACSSPMLLQQLRTRNAINAPRSVCMRATAPTAILSERAAQRVQLGDSDLQVSQCCLGTMTWGQQNTEAEAHEQLNFSFDNGINFLDAAEMYPVPTRAETQGRTEQYIGTWLKQRNRSDVILATKVAGAAAGITWLRDDGAGSRVTRKQIHEAVNKSLSRLQTDYIDLYQIHWPDRYMPLFQSGSYDVSKEREFTSFVEQLEAFDELVKAGKIRYLGVSNETSYGVMEFCHAAELKGLPKIVSIQNVYSMLARIAFETDLIETCRWKNVGLLAYSPLAGGVLSGKYSSGNVPENSRMKVFQGFMSRYLEPTKAAVGEYMEIASKYGMTPAEMAMAFVNTRWFVASTIIGATTMDQLRENIKAFDLTLPDDCVKDINAVYNRYRDPSLSV